MNVVTRITLLAASLIVCAASFSVRAQDAAPIRSNCQPPAVPAQPMNQATADGLQADIEKYKSCIQTFADGQIAQANRHRAAANAAVDEFNEFVNTKIPKPPPPAK